MSTMSPERLSFYDAIGRNKRNSLLLIAAVFALLLAVLYVFATVYAYAVTGEIGIPFWGLLILLPLALIVLLADALPAYYYGDRLVLKSAKAYTPDPRAHLHLLNVVEGLSIAAGIRRPDVYIIPSKDINAFATGRDPDHASIAVTEGALEKLSRKELEGVIGHEVSHIRNYDIRYTLVIAAVVGAVAIISEMFLRSVRHMNLGGGNRKGGGAAIVALIVLGMILAIVAPIVVRIAQLAYSRQREYLADASGVEVTRNPHGLAAALQKIKEGNRRDLPVSEVISHLFIDDPKNGFMDSIFETHPPIESRIERLKAMG